MTENIGVALRRFGLCGGPGEIERLGADPRHALLQQLDAPLEAFPGLPDTRDSLLAYAANRDAQIARSGRAAIKMREAGMMAPAPVSTTKVPTLRDAQERDIEQRFRHTMSTNAPLQERLAMFWCNHFAVAGERGVAAAVIGSFERDAIRPHMFGRFADMLIASSLHPAMLLYLQNENSVGRNSPKGAGRKRGVNENLGREILELHSLGADGGYTQADVTIFANVLSGWTVLYPPKASESETGARFDPALHEPGEKTILGRRYRDDGPDQAVNVLRDLAVHPATARHVAAKMARHFVGDYAPRSLAARLEANFLATGGDLRELSRTLVAAPEVWRAPQTKLRQPLEFVLSSCRVLGLAPPTKELIPLLKALGQPYQLPPSPQGWDEGDESWATADGIKTRLDWVNRFSFAANITVDPRDAARQAFGSDLSDATRLAIDRAANPQQAVSLLLMSPEMQRR
jgi:uncharacterized protein (DUF1800 family)